MFVCTFPKSNESGGLSCRHYVAWLKQRMDETCSWTNGLMNNTLIDNSCMFVSSEFALFLVHGISRKLSSDDLNAPLGWWWWSPHLSDGASSCTASCHRVGSWIKSSSSFRSLFTTARACVSTQLVHLSLGLPTFRRKSHLRIENERVSKRIWRKKDSSPNLAILPKSSSCDLRRRLVSGCSMACSRTSWCDIREI